MANDKQIARGSIQGRYKEKGKLKPSQLFHLFWNEGNLREGDVLLGLPDGTLDRIGGRGSLVYRGYATQLDQLYKASFGDVFLYKGNSGDTLDDGTVLNTNDLLLCLEAPSEKDSLYLPRWIRLATQQGGGSGIGIDGDQIILIRNADSSLDRVRINPDGLYFEHRDYVGAVWYEIASSTSVGVRTTQVFSDSTLYLTNQDIEERRDSGLDIGNQYLHPDAKVYHFDNNVFDQHGVNDLIIEDADVGGSHELVGASRNDGSGLDFTPAILAVAPYATNGASLYGKYGIRAYYPKCWNFTVDFWIQYIKAENQTIFDVGNEYDRIRLAIASAEPYVYDEDDSCPYNLEASETESFQKVETSELYVALDVNSTYFDRATVYYTLGREDGRPAYVPVDIFDYDEFRSLLRTGLYVKAVKSVNEDGTISWNYYSESEPVMIERATDREYEPNKIYYVYDDSGELTEIEINEYNFDYWYSVGLYEMSFKINEPAPAHSYIEHWSSVGNETAEFEDLGISFEPNSWLHIGVVGDGDKFRVMLDDIAVEFSRAGSSEQPLDVVLNAERNAFFLDELYVDVNSTEDLATFTEHTINRIPWAALDKSNDYLVIAAKDPALFKTNLFDSPLFKQKVLDILSEYHSGP